jgi:hypothetical protein
MPESAAEKKTEDWMTSKWRPMMAMTYMATILFDFIVGPILFNILQYYNPGQAVTSWTPLTLQGGGLYHLAMGAILGISAYTRGKEKEAMINAGMDPNGGGSAPAVVPQPPVMMAQPPQGFAPQQTWAPSAPPAAAPASESVNVTVTSGPPIQNPPPPSSGFGKGF